MHIEIAVGFLTPTENSSFNKFAESKAPVNEKSERVANV